ncbi:MAG: FecR domain-containing protein [Saprospiraceae bacterium]|nr:FecR domain-containing protein [Saprospiraceae bacterium]
MNYTTFSAEDFAANESFQDFFLHQQPDAVKFWTRWIEEHPEKLDEINAAKTLLERLSLGIQAEETQAALKDLKQEINHRREKGRVIKIRRRWYAAAAVAAAILALIVVLPLLRSPEPSWVVVETDYGQLREVYLPDSSFVTLNSNSKIRYQADWSKDQDREVWMEGEAFFDVRKNPKIGGAEFHVHAEEASVQVLGTSFNVYQRKEDIIVALATGKVSLNTSYAKHQMEPNDVIELHNGEVTQISQDVNLELYTSWRNRKLVLDNTSISKVIDMLEENMGLEVQIDNPAVLNRKLTATLPINEVDILLTALTEIYGLDIRKEENTIWIK